MTQILSYNKYEAGAIHWISYVVDKHYRSLVDEVCRLVLNSKPTSILDVGCGDGLYSKIFINNGIITCGIDSCPKALQLAMDHGVRHVQCTEAEKFKFKDRFGTILFFDTLEHLIDSDKVLKTYKKWCDYVWILNPYPTPENKEKPKYHNEEWTDEQLIQKLEIKGYKTILAQPMIGHNKTLFQFSTNA